MSLNHIVAVSGKAGSGKDELARAIIAARPSFTRASFADSVKDLACNYLPWYYDDNGVPSDVARPLRRADIESWKSVDIVPNGWLISMRGALIKIGDGLRDISPSIWIEQILRKVNGNLVFTDVRYINEIHGLTKAGAIKVRIFRDVASAAGKHSNNRSEVELDELAEIALKSSAGTAPGRCWPCSGDFDYVIFNTGTIAELGQAANELLSISDAVVVRNDCSSCFSKSPG